MPCMGPDLEAARKHGNCVAQSFLDEIICVGQLIDLGDEKYDGMVTLPGARERWGAAKAAFVKAVEDLFVEDAANGF